MSGILYTLIMAYSSYYHKSQNKNSSIEEPGGSNFLLDPPFPKEYFLVIRFETEKRTSMSTRFITRVEGIF